MSSLLCLFGLLGSLGLLFGDFLGGPGLLVGDTLGLARIVGSGLTTVADVAAGSLTHALCAVAVNPGIGIGHLDDDTVGDLVDLPATARLCGRARLSHRLRMAPPRNMTSIISKPTPALAIIPPISETRP